MADPVSAAVIAAASIGTNIAGLIQAQHQQNWQNAAYVNELNNRRALQQYGMDWWQNSANPARDSYLQGRDWYSNALYGPGGSQENLINLMTQFPGLIQQYTGNPFEAGINGEMQSLLGQNAERMGFYDPIADTAQQGFLGGGWTPNREASQNMLMQILQGQGAQMGTLSDVGLDLLGQRGQTAFTRGYQDRGMDAMNSGGMTDPLRTAQQIANHAGARGLDLINREALLTPDQAANFAGESAAQATQGAYQRAQRQALARRGKAASVVAAGGNELDPMSEWADAASQNVSDARRKALMEQQGLGLQQMGLGSQMALGSGGLFPDLQRAATGNVGTVGGLGLNAAQLENARMGTGNSLLDTYLQAQGRAGGLMNQSMTDQGQYALGLGGLGINAQNAGQTGRNNLFNNYLAGGGFGAALNQQNFGMNNQYFQNLLGLNRDNNTNYQSMLTGLFNLSNQGQNLAMGGMTGTATPNNYINTQPMYQGIAQGLSNVNFGGLTNRQPQQYTPVPISPVNLGGGGGGIAQPSGGSWTPPPYNP